VDGVNRALELLPGLMAVARLGPGEGVPHWCVQSEPILSITRTPDEISIVCEERLVPSDVGAERGFRALRLAGPIDFAATGVLAALVAPLAAASVSVFALATYDTDYVLVRAADLARARAAWRDAGFDVSETPAEGR
jgi:uncharacterized protein